MKATVSSRPHDGVDAAAAARRLCRRGFVIAVVCAMVVACAVESEPDAPGSPADTMPAAAAAMPLPDLIVAERGGFIPEGIEYDMANGRLLTGSLSEGTIFEIHPDGSVVPAVSDPDLVSSVGIEVDELRDRLLVANSDFAVFQNGAPGQAKLGVYNLASGDRIAMVDLAAAIPDVGADAAYFANDVVAADDGAAYVTDTQMNLIYRVSPEYEASVLHRFGDGGAGPNGIVEHPAGYLLVARGATLWKVPLDNPAGAAEVTLPEEIPGQDGMVWSAGRLAIVSSANRVVALTSSDDWVTADLAAAAGYDTPATTAAVVGDDVYVVHPAFAGDTPPSFERVVFR